MGRNVWNANSAVSIERYTITLNGVSDRLNLNKNAIALIAQCANPSRVGADVVALNRCARATQLAVEEEPDADPGQSISRDHITRGIQRASDCASRSLRGNDTVSILQRRQTADIGSNVVALHQRTSRPG